MSTAKTTSAGSAVHAIVNREWQHQLRNNPVYASVLGDRRWNDVWDDRSIAAIDADHTHTRAVLRELDAVPRAELSAEEKLDLDLLRREYELWTEEYAFALHLLPLHQLGGLPEGLRQPPFVQSAYQLADTLRFSTVRDYEDWIVRLQRFPAYVEQITALMREGARRGLIHPRVVLQRIPGQIQRQLTDDPTKSGFYGPFTRFPAHFSEADRTRLAQAARAAISDGVLPALRGLHEFLIAEYIPAAQEEVGAWRLPGGVEMYEFLARKFTTTSLKPEEIHQLGLAEVARIRGEMERVKAKSGFTGSLPEFFHFLRTDARFYCTSAEELLMRYRALAKQIDPRLVRLFKTFPRQPYGVEPTPEAMAQDVTAGFYYPGAADGSRPGTYQINLYRPETRPTWDMVPLTLHEAVPGHHFQIALAAEQTHLSDFRRHGAQHIAYIEGWALYCETLGGELGLYDNPYDEFGQLAFDMWRAVRLVVDTGIHAKKWTRQQAIDYALATSPRPENDMINEVDRYIALPGQALAYKIGQLKIRELRTRAEEGLGGRFDVGAFHDAVLLDGSLPLDILERRIEGWTAAQKA